MTTTELPQTETDMQYALDALTGWRCSRCKKTLLTANNHICCGDSYCPFCGRRNCEHQVASSFNGERPCLNYQFSSSVPVAPQELIGTDDGNVLFTRMMDWSETQKRQAFGEDFPLLHVLFGPRLSGHDLPRRAGGWFLVEEIVQPDRHSAVRDSYGLRHVYYQESLQTGLTRLAQFNERFEGKSQTLCEALPECHRFFVGMTRYHRTVHDITFSEKGLCLHVHSGLSVRRVCLDDLKYSRKTHGSPNTESQDIETSFLHNGRTRLVRDGSYRLRLQNVETGEFLEGDLLFRWKPGMVAVAADGETVAVIYKQRETNQMTAVLLWRFPTEHFYPEAGDTK